MRVREEKKLRASHARGGRRHAVPFLRIVHLPTDSLLEEQKKKKSSGQDLLDWQFLLSKKTASNTHPKRTTRARAPRAR